MIRHLRWYIAGLLTLATTINYLDRQALSVAAPELRRVFDMSNTEYSWIVSAFLLAYGVMHPVAGRAIDWLNTRRGYLLAVTWWSIASIGHALAGGVASFAVARALLGVGESGNFPAAVKTIAQWFPDKEKSIATGIFNTGAGLGALIAPPLVVWIITRFGWQKAFIFTGLSGSLWIALWLLLYHPPEKHPRITPEELEYIRSGQQMETVAESCRSEGLLEEIRAGRQSLVNLAALCLARAMTDSVWTFWVFWLPNYLKDARDLTLLQIGAIAWIPFLAGDFGSLIGGWLSPLFIRRGASVLLARKLALSVSASLMPASVLVGCLNVPLAICCVSFCTLGHQMWASNILTLPADLFPKRMVAAAYGWTGMCGILGCFLSTLMTGRMVDEVGYDPILFAAGLMHPVGAALLFSQVRLKRSPENSPTRGGIC